MKFDSANNTLTLLSNIAVLVGIVFLIVELNQNTREMRNEVSWSRAALATELNLTFVTNSELAGSLMRVGSLSSTDMDAADRLDRSRASVYIETFLVHFETRYLTQISENERMLVKEGFQRFMDRGPGVRFLALDALEGKDHDFQQFAREAIAEMDNGTLQTNQQ